jgi:hypothetical protein
MRLDQKARWNAKRSNFYCKISGLAISYSRWVEIVAQASGKLSAAEQRGLWAGAV